MCGKYILNLPLKKKCTIARIIEAMLRILQNCAQFLGKIGSIFGVKLGQKAADFVGCGCKLFAFILSPRTFAPYEVHSTYYVHMVKIYFLKDNKD